LVSGHSSFTISRIFVRSSFGSDIRGMPINRDIREVFTRQ
jgi:hypothetical protein